MDNEELDQLQFQKVGMIQQIEGMAKSEITFEQANEEMVAFVKEKELQDGLISGNGSSWKEISFAPSVEINSAPTPENASNIAGQAVEEKHKCCVIA